MCRAGTSCNDADLVEDNVAELTSASRFA